MNKTPDEMEALEAKEESNSEFTNQTEDAESLQLTTQQDEELDASAENIVQTEGTELEVYESAQIEEIEFLPEERLDSILESALFASDRPVSLAALKQMFKGTNITTEQIKRSLDRFAIELAGATRGVSLEEVTGGFQLRTKVDNMDFLARTVKVRPFRLSGPALEVLAVVAYKQPVVKNEIDEIRGVESGHLLRALMEKNLVSFEGKSDLPGKPMQYATTRKFLEIFGLRNLNELPSLSQIDELLPEGMGEEDGGKTTLSQLTSTLSEQFDGAYSTGEEELQKISSELEVISASSEFFEQEKLKQRQKREAEKAQNLREALMLGEQLSTRDKNWLIRYDEAQMKGESFQESDDAKKTSVTSEPHAAVEEFALETLSFEEHDEGTSTEEHFEANDLADLEE